MCGAAERWEPAVALPQRAGSSAAAAGPGGSTHAAPTRAAKARGLSPQPVGCTRPFPSKT